MTPRSPGTGSVNNSILARVGRLLGRSMEAMGNSFGSGTFCGAMAAKSWPRPWGYVAGGRVGAICSVWTEHGHLDTAFMPRSRHLRLAPRNNLCTVSVLNCILRKRPHGGLICKPCRWIRLVARARISSSELTRITRKGRSSAIGVARRLFEASRKTVHHALNHGRAIPGGMASSPR